MILNNNTSQTWRETSHCTSWSSSWRFQVSDKNPRYSVNFRPNVHVARLCYLDGKCHFPGKKYWKKCIFNRSQQQAVSLSLLRICLINNNVCSSELIASQGQKRNATKSRWSALIDKARWGNAACAVIFQQRFITIIYSYFHQTLAIAPFMI